MLLMVALTLLTACSSDDDDQIHQPGLEVSGSAEALNDYWPAGTAATVALTDADDLWAIVASLAANTAIPADSTLGATLDYAAACSLAAAEIHAWYELEEAVNRFGGNKSQVDEEALEAAMAVLATAEQAVLAGGEGLVLSWKVLGGLASRRDALVDPDGTIPVLGFLATALADRQIARDVLVTAAIIADDDQRGLLPLDQLEGSTPSARAAYYAELANEHTVKRLCRATVPAFEAGEINAALSLLDEAARGSFRIFNNVGPGGSTVADLPTHLTGAQESSPTVHTMTLNLEGGDITNAVVILSRRGQPDEAPRQALLTQTTAGIILDLPAGQYDVLAMANGWARAVAADVTTSAGGTWNLRLSSLADETLIFDGIEGPAMAGVGNRIELVALASSTSGDDLNFAWDFGETEVADVILHGPSCTFTTATTGDLVASVLVSDSHGNARTGTSIVEITPFDVRVVRTEFLQEQVVDMHLNPGESDTLQLWVANRGDIDVVGTPSIVGHDGIQAICADETWTLVSGNQTRMPVTVIVPVDYGLPKARLDFGFTVDGVTLIQELEYRVDFYTELNYIPSPVFSRIMTVSGTVANPLLDTATLIIDRDVNNIYTLPLESGSFEQVIILPGSDEPRRMHLELIADSGSRRASFRAGFIASIAKADFRATLFWDTNGTDVDLWVTDPAQEKCYFAHKTTASGLELDVDDVTGYGPENITGESDLPAGEYLVQLHYYSDHGTNLASHCTVVITLYEGTEDEQVEVYEQTISNGDIWTVTTVDWGTDGALSLATPPTPLITSAPASIPVK